MSQRSVSPVNRAFVAALFAIGTLCGGGGCPANAEIDAEPPSPRSFEIEAALVCLDYFNALNDERDDKLLGEVFYEHRLEALLDEVKYFDRTKDAPQKPQYVAPDADHFSPSTIEEIQHGIFLYFKNRHAQLDRSSAWYIAPDCAEEVNHSK